MPRTDDHAQQFQIQANDSAEPINGAITEPENPSWSPADVEFVSGNLTGATIPGDQPHDQKRWQEALAAYDPLELDKAAADVERRQREVDFNETQAEAAAIYQEAIAATADTANIIIDLRGRFRSDDGTINGVQVG